jgi:hypothetical protein
VRVGGALEVQLRALHGGALKGITMKRFVLLGALSILLACGGSDNSSALNGSFAGTWNGATTLTLAGYSPYSYPASLVIAVNDVGATASNICPGIGDGHTLTLTVQGSGNSATWSGILVCNPVQFSGCSSVVFTFNNASAALNPDGSLSGQGSGSASGCGMTLDFTFAFFGQQH